jgi:hypothetical protein
MSSSLLEQDTQMRSCDDGNTLKDPFRLRGTKRCQWVAPVRCSYQSAHQSCRDPTAHSACLRSTKPYPCRLTTTKRLSYRNPTQFPTTIPHPFSSPPPRRKHIEFLYSRPNQTQQKQTPQDKQGGQVVQLIYEDAMSPITGRSS